MHFLKRTTANSITPGHTIAAVRTILEKSSLVIQPAGVVLANADTVWMAIPSSFEILGFEGRTVKPSNGKSFYVAAETINPFHLIAEF